MDEQPIEVFGRLGRVLWFDARKGFGFIEATGPECAFASVEASLRDAKIFVHFSVIDGPGYRRLRDGQIVRFDATRAENGWKATRVEAASDDPGASGVGAVPKRPPGLL